MSEQMDAEVPRVWVRAFYGFDPEGAGYIGFSRKKIRDDMMGLMQDGDLVLIYGAAQDLTDRHQRSQALGFLEIQCEPCFDRERMSAASVAWKNDHGFEDRWNFGIKVRRAWRVRNRVAIKSIAPLAYENKLRFERTTRAVLLSPEERRRALSHPVSAANVFGEPPNPDAESSSAPLEKLLKPSQGIPPNFGIREAVYEDGQNELYLMILSSDAKILLGDRPEYRGKALAKIGRSNDPKRRLGELNAGFPEPSMVKWAQISRQAFDDGATAHALEITLKAVFDSEFKSVGGEFFVGGRAEMDYAFQRFCVSNLPKILGARAKAKGL